MFMVVFELHPATGKKDEHLAFARQLKPIVDSIDGFIDNERFESVYNPGKVAVLTSWNNDRDSVRWTPGMFDRREADGTRPFR